MPQPTRRTIARATEITGTALHSGGPASIRFAPAAAGTGIRFRRLDRPESDIPALADHASHTDRRTVLGGADGVQTVEHVLAAVRIAGLDDLDMAVSGGEPPIADGSAQPFLEALTAAGIREQAGHAAHLEIMSPFVVTEGDSRYVVSPSRVARLTASINFDHPLIGRQSGCWDLTPEIMAAELAGSRTFGVAEQYSALRARGLAQGATADNLVILTADGLAGGSLRWPDEFVRHKALDLLGDLVLAGGPVRADITAYRPSHAGNVALARALRRIATSGASPVMGIEDILAKLPHRYPMLLVDRILEIQGRERIVGIKNVTFNEPFFQGHFPGHPVMPGVLIVEAMAQCGGMLLMGMVDHPESKVVYFMSIDAVKFRRPVVPGDQLRFEVEMLQFRGKSCRMRGQAYVDGQVAAEAEMMAAIADR